MATTVSNIRPLAIFTGYMVTAAALTSKCISIILSSRTASSSGQSQTKNTPPRRPRPVVTLLFALLAAVSLATTWYHMFRYFRWSYLDWAEDHLLPFGGDLDPSAGPYLGAWLRDTSLFRQAWASTLETPPRAWWSLQIFGFCAHWSVMLALQARKRRIPHAWAFMLLGQVVAISFASNLFFLAVLLYDVAADDDDDDEEEDDIGGKGGKVTKTPSPSPSLSPSTALFWYPTIFGFTIGWALEIPNQFGRPRFMPMLLGPHVFAFAPLLLNAVLRADLPARLLNPPSWYVRAGFMTALVAVATSRVVSAGGDWALVKSTLYEHPAVSSVGWDVICCWVSYAAWAVLGEA
ncbi:hypothetical protein SODALDRAFT_330803 [Sodiomyces alkalinus F11]|uniref:Uncharacterized protein n=1 Tax=Sodiomyces alkalinus (strain CBS 110278 / VKM F-3762 / F11) TaxID=1314773 RepID=A0A3N2Q2V0_SODAK|nr:hypothetical protein SODALDRAFT_330803 [Sodiomyces alkalinus F11]ROT41083.1 hypothetical protein SODALDRAFT_330803 [Sodiomyces alkalinus F11]